MALTNSDPLALGFKAPDFTLYDTVDDKEKSLDELKSDKATVIFFICNHCPYVKHIQEALVNLAIQYIPKGFSFIGISSNDVVEYPEDGPGHMHLLAKELAFPFPYLYDEDQSVAKAYNAVCTPDFYVFNKKLECVYHGQFDDSRPGNTIIPTGRNIRETLDAIESEGIISPKQEPSVGCSIKWKKK